MFAYLVLLYLLDLYGWKFHGDNLFEATDTAKKALIAELVASTSAIKGFAELTYTHVAAAMTAVFKRLKKDQALNMQMRQEIGKFQKKIQKIPPKAQMRESQDRTACTVNKCSWCYLSQRGVL